LIFEGIAKDFVAIDSIWFKETAQGIEITWQADISFEGHTGTFTAHHEACTA
jgi:hypothetical protein